MARVRRLLFIGAFAGIAYLVWRWQRKRTEQPPHTGFPGAPEAERITAPPPPTFPSEQPPSAGGPAAPGGPRPIPTRVHRGPPPAPGAKPSGSGAQPAREAAPALAEQTPASQELGGGITPPPVERPAETAAPPAEQPVALAATPAEAPTTLAEIPAEELVATTAAHEPATMTETAAEEPAAETPAEEAEAAAETPLEAPVEEETLVAREVAGTTASAPAEAPVKETLPAEGSTPVNVNTADYESLVALPGIGPALAQRIIAYREEHGPFASVEELQKVQGIGPRNLDEFRHLITV